MKIKEIYDKYFLPENLQLHMLRVAACSNLIMDNWSGPSIKKEAVINACLFHDIGNMVKISDDEIEDENFRKIREKYILRFGKDDHIISLNIAKEYGMDDFVIFIMNDGISKENERTLRNDSYETKIRAYCDQRAAPNGIV